MGDLPIFEEAERNEDGELVVKRNGRFGDKHEVSLTKLFQPGKRKTNSERMLKFEARRKADPEQDDPGNPAFPVTPELGKRVSEWCEEQGIEPAWVDGPAKRDDL